MKSVVYRRLAIRFFSCAVVLLLFSCDGEQSREQPADPYARLKEMNVPEFNADSAYIFVKNQVDCGPRVPNTEAHRRCGDYLVNTLKNYGWEVTEQKFDAIAFDGTVLKSRNIIAAYNPAATKRILLAAHWDSRPFADADSVDTHKPILGANDGASGVGVLLEVARALQSASTPVTIGVDIILFDSEDYGQPENSKVPRKENTWCLGSQHWAQNKHIPGYSAYYGILLDMVGGKDARFAKDAVSMQHAPSVVNKVWGIAAAAGYGHHFVDVATGSLIDDHYYVNTIAKIPMIDIIEYDPSDDVYFNNRWHTHGDNMDNIDRSTLKAVGTVIVHTLYFEQ